MNQELDAYKEHLKNSATVNSIDTNDISEHIFDEYLNELKNLNRIKYNNNNNNNNNKTTTTYLNNISQQVNQNLILNICNEINELNKYVLINFII